MISGACFLAVLWGWRGGNTKRAWAPPALHAWAKCCIEMSTALLFPYARGKLVPSNTKARSAGLWHGTSPYIFHDMPQIMLLACSCAKCVCDL